MEAFYLKVIALGVLGMGMLFFLWQLVSSKKKRRFDSLAHYAARHGLAAADQKDLDPKQTFAPVRLFCIKSPGHVSNVFTGTNPAMWIFDYEYTITFDQTVGQTVAVFKSDKLKWPQLIIESRQKKRFTVEAMRRLTQNVANWQLGLNKVDYSDQPAFRQSYRVFTGEHQANVKKSIPQSLIDSLNQNPGWNLETLNRWAIFYRPGNYVKPKEFDAYFDSVLGFYKCLMR